MSPIHYSRTNSFLLILLFIIYLALKRCFFLLKKKIGFHLKTSLSVYSTNIRIFIIHIILLLINNWLKFHQPFLLFPRLKHPMNTRFLKPLCFYFLQLFPLILLSKISRYLSSMSLFLSFNLTIIYELLLISIFTRRQLLVAGDLKPILATIWTCVMQS